MDQNHESVGGAFLSTRDFSLWSRGAQSLHSHVVVVQLRETHSISLAPKQRELTQGSMPMCLTIFILNVDTRFEQCC